MRPLIGITLSLDPGLRWRAGRDYLYVARAYSQALERAGALPVLLPPEADPIAICRHVAGVVITGGEDLPARLEFGAAEPARFSNLESPAQPEVPERINADRALLAALVASNTPVLGICYGMQLINLHFGGSLLMDVHHHSQVDHGGGSNVTQHDVQLAQSSPLWSKRPSRLRVNSCHRQAIDLLAPGARATAHAPDGVIEALEFGHCFGVQWHPETMPEGAPWLTRFVDLCRG